MLVLQGEWEYDRYMSKMLRKLKQPHAMRASCYIMHPGAHTDHEGSELLYEGFGGCGQRQSQEPSGCGSLPCSLYEDCTFPKSLLLFQVLYWFPTTC